MLSCRKIRRRGYGSRLTRARHSPLAGTKIKPPTTRFDRYPPKSPIGRLWLSLCREPGQLAANMDDRTASGILLSLSQNLVSDRRRITLAESNVLQQI